MAAIALAPAKETSQKVLHHVVIAAAVTAVFGSRARILNITEVKGSSSGVVVPLTANHLQKTNGCPSRWVKQGRTDIQASHNGNGLGMRVMGSR